MTRRLITLLAVAAFALATTPATTPATAAPTTRGSGAAQRQQGAARFEERIQKLKDALAQLDLSADQKQQIEQVFTDTKSKLLALKGQAKSGGRDAAKSQVQQILQDARQQVLKILTDSQKEKLKEILKSDRAAQKGAQQGSRKNTQKA